jgi:large subunit ribosomal protein L11
VVITVYQDRSFTFITKSPPASVLIKKLAGLASGSKTPGREKAGKITRSQIKQIVQTKSKDINARSEAAAMRIIEGTARSMGVEVIDG